MRAEILAANPRLLEALAKLLDSSKGTTAEQSVATLVGRLTSPTVSHGR